MLAAIDLEGGSAGVPPARRPIGANILQHAKRLLTDRRRHLPESRAPIATTGAWPGR